MIESCCLGPDIKLLPAGDATEIGERGINLSGGQKARVCLARAVYANKSLYLLDDPLSSLDSNVANHIIDNCFCGLLKDKTRVLVTHRVKVLSKTDRIVYMDKGEIVKIIKTAQNTESEEINNLLNFENFRKPEEHQEKPENKCKNTEYYMKLIEKENKKTGKVNESIYLEYLKSPGTYIFSGLCVISYIIFELSSIFSDIFLKQWSENPSDTSQYITLYISLKLFGCFFSFLTSVFIYLYHSIQASAAIHSKLLKNLIQAPVNLFFDVTPVGRILKRFSGDMSKIDEQLSEGLTKVLFSIISTFSIIIMTVIYAPYLVILIPAIFFPGKYIANRYLLAARELTRFESISMAPILSHITETFKGRTVICAFKQQKEFIKQSNEKINYNTSVNYLLFGCKY